MKLQVGSTSSEVFLFFRSLCHKENQIANQECMLLSCYFSFEVKYCNFGVFSFSSTNFGVVSRVVFLFFEEIFQLRSTCSWVIYFPFWRNILTREYHFLYWTNTPGCSLVISDLHVLPLEIQVIYCSSQSHYMARYQCSRDQLAQSERKQAERHILCVANKLI